MLATITHVDTGLVPGTPEQRSAAVGDDRVADETDPAADVRLSGDDEVGAHEALVESRGASHLGAGDHVGDETGPEDPDVVDPAELDLVEEALADVETALERLADGSYGTCEVCSRRIADDQLLRDPTARRCAEHLPLRAG